MRPFDVEPVGPYYNGLGKSLGDTAVVIYPIDTSKQPLNLNPTIPTPIKEIPVIPILLLVGIIIYLLLNK